MNNKTIKESIYEHSAELSEMQPVKELEGVLDMSKMSFAKRTEIIEEEYRKFGKHVEREDLGTIDLSDKQINQALKYLKTYEENAVFFAVPKVIKTGIVISETNNHKGRGYETITIAAPVILNRKRFNVGVVLKRTKGLRYKMHRIVAVN